MLSMSVVTALLNGSRAEAREVFEGLRTADYISPEEMQNKHRGKRVKKYYFKNKGSKSA